MKFSGVIVWSCLSAILAGVPMLAQGSVRGQDTVQPVATVPGAADTSQKPRVFVTDSDTWQAVGGGGYGSFGIGGTAAAPPQTAEVIKTLTQRCLEVTVNNRPDMSDYIVRLVHETNQGALSHKDKILVFARKTGDAIYSKSTMTVSGSVQGACWAISKHWDANAAMLASLPAAAGGVVGVPVPAGGYPAAGRYQGAGGYPAPVAAAAPGAVAAPAAVVTAGLTVDSTVPGSEIEIDGEFVGSTPSTVAVAPGRHLITVKKKGYSDWSRWMTVSGAAVRVSADLQIMLPLGPPPAAAVPPVEVPATVTQPVGAPLPAPPPS
jgi:hypothetical protein